MLRSRANRPYFSAVSELRVQTRPNHLRVPDICLVRQGSPREQIVITAPLLCIEVNSPEDRWNRTLVRVREFLAMGIPEVWVVDPELRTVQVCAGDTIIEHASGSLRVPETPIEVSLSALFAVLDEA